MTTKKPTPVTTTAKGASIPKRPVIQHTKLLTATLQAEHRKAQGALQEADMALSLAVQERDDAIIATPLILALFAINEREDDED